MKTTKKSEKLIREEKALHALLLEIVDILVYLPEVPFKRNLCDKWHNWNNIKLSSNKRKGK